MCMLVEHANKPIYWFYKSVTIMPTPGLMPYQREKTKVKRSATDKTEEERVILKSVKSDGLPEERTHRFDLQFYPWKSVSWGRRLPIPLGTSQIAKDVFFCILLNYLNSVLLQSVR